MVGVTTRLPNWLRREIPSSSAEKTHHILGRHRLTTVCEEAQCPNRTECYSRSTATFMILGDVCTRRCHFCAVETGRGLTVEADEPTRVAVAARELGLQYVVVTSVARDDLPDEGAQHFVETIQAIRREVPEAKVEVLTPDFHARWELIECIVKAEPDVFNHNIETVRRLQTKIRPQADYERSLKVLRMIKEIDRFCVAKSGLMLGLGETESEIFQTATDLRDSGCDILTLGQYLSPSLSHLPVEAFIPPAYFDELAVRLRELGFKNVFAGPYVRSSYHAGEVFEQGSLKKE